MSNYTKTVNFATKDNLSPGNPLKIVKGTEIDTEFNNIATAVATKTDGAASSTDNAIARFDSTTGKIIQNSAVTIDDTTGDIVGTATQGVFNTVSTTVNAFGAATTLNLGAATGTATVANTTLAAKAITASTTLAVTGASTLTGAVTASSTLAVTGAATLSSTLAVTGVATLGNGAVLGTPTSATLTNATGLPISTGVSGLGSNVATFLATPSSANLISAVTDETGTGALVFATSPTLVTPILGTPTSGVATNLTGLPLTTGVTGLLPVANGGTATATPSIVAGTNITVTGTWPNQTIAASGGSGTVTSVDVSGGTTGLTTSGGPVTSSGTVTLAGTLAVANGGTGQTSYTNGQLLIGNTTGNTLTKATLTAGSGITITNGTGSISIAASGGGDVAGPASSTDNAIARFDSTTGKIIQNSVVTIADTTGDVAGVGSLSTTGVISAVISGGTANAGNAFWFSDNSASAMMYARQNGAGDLFALSAGATEQFRVTAGGVAQVASGVKFPATQSASSDANTLDDYEEGTWTPNQGSNLTVVGTFSSSGTYTKIGRIVVVQGTVTGSTSIAVTQGGLVCSNLPFNVSGNAFGAMTNNAADIASISWGQSSNIYSGPAITATSNIRFTNTYFV